MASQPRARSVSSGRRPSVQRTYVRAFRPKHKPIPYVLADGIKVCVVELVLG